MRVTNVTLDDLADNYTPAAHEMLAKVSRHLLRRGPRDLVSYPDPDSHTPKLWGQGLGTTLREIKTDGCDAISGRSSIALGGAAAPPIHIKCRPCHEIAAPPSPPPPLPPHSVRAHFLPYVTHAHLESTPFVCVCGGGGGGGGRQFLKSFSDYEI